VITVELHGLRVFGHHGVYDEERANGQDFLFDVELEVAVGPAAGMFVRNLRTWSGDPALAGRVSPGEVEALAARLGARLADDARGVIRWHIRQVVKTRPA